MTGILTVDQRLAGAPFSTPASRPASPSGAQNSKAESRVPQGGEGCWRVDPKRPAGGQFRLTINPEAPSFQPSHTALDPTELCRPFAHPPPAEPCLGTKAEAWLRSQERMHTGLPAEQRALPRRPLDAPNPLHGGTEADIVGLRRRAAPTLSNLTPSLQ